MMTATDVFLFGILGVSIALWIMILIFKIVIQIIKDLKDRK